MPDGWHFVELRDVVPKPRPKVAADKKSDLPFIGMDHIEPNSFELVGQGKFAEMKSAGSYFKPGDILYGRLRPYLNKIHQAKFEGVASAEFIVLPASKTHDNGFLKYLLHQREFVKHAMSRVSGDRPRVKFDGIADFKFRLPPLNEQRRIVEKIETLFMRLDKGEEALHAIQKLLARYRQSVLKAAVTGELTDSDPKTWTSVTLGALLKDIRYGTAKKCLPNAEGIAVLRIPNVANGEIDLQDLKYAQLDDREVEKLGLRKGDLLIVRSNGSANLVGRGAVVNEDAVGLAFAGYLIRLRVDQMRLLPDFLQLVLSSPVVRARIERQARSTSGVHNINSGEVKAIAFDLPSVDVQAEIIELVDGHTAKIGDLEAWCDTELARSAALRQSILKDAFAGRLVPQNPAEEPAATLLTRIKETRATESKKERRRNTV